MSERVFERSESTVPVAFGARCAAPPGSAAPDRQGFVHRIAVHQLGLPVDVVDGSRPVIAIANTWSELNPCNSGLRDVAEAVKRGVWEAGGVPLEMPVMSLGEPLHAAELDALPQPAGDGDRGAAAGQPGRRRGAARRVRQDGAGTADGSGQRRPAGGDGDHRADARRRGVRPAARVGHRRLATHRGRPSGRAGGGRARRRRGGPRPLARALHDDGHRFDDGLSHRGARADAAGRGVDPGRRPGPPRPRPPGRASGRRHGRRRPPPVGAAHRGVVPQRHRGQRRHRRLDQRRAAPAGDGRARRRRAGPRRRRPGRPRRPAARRSQAVGPLPDGRLPHRRRPRRGDRRAAGRRLPRR